MSSISTADSNRVRLALARETGFAEDPPDPSPTLTDLRFTSESLGQDTDTTRSNEIRADRQVGDVIRNSLSATGDTNHELSFSTYDDLFESALLADSAFSSEIVLVNSATVDFTASGSTVESVGDFTSATLGEWVLIEGSSEPSNNGYFKILDKTNDDLTLGRGDASIADSSSDSGVTITQLSSITNGTTLNTYVIEKAFEDLTDEFEALLGMAINSWSLSLSTGSIATTTFSWIGSKAKSNTATIGDGSNTPATTTDVMNAVDNVPLILEGSGGTNDLAVQSLNFTLTNNIRAKEKIGTLGAFALGTGTIDLTGTLEAFFQEKAAIDSYLNFTKTHIAFRLTDAAGNVYIIDIPTIKYTDGQRVAGGINQDVIAELSFTAFRDADEGVTVRIVKDSA